MRIGFVPFGWFLYWWKFRLFGQEHVSGRLLPIASLVFREDKVRQPHEKDESRLIRSPGEYGVTAPCGETSADRCSLSVIPRR